MSYIGTTKIGKMFLGSTEIAKAYLGNTLVFKKGGGSSAVPYIRGGTGGAYIDTGITPDRTTKVIVWARNFNPATRSNWLFGSRVANQNAAFTLSTVSDEKTGVIRVGYANTNYDTNDKFSLLSNYHKYELDGNVFKVDGTVVTTATSANFSNQHNIYLFGLNNGGSYAGCITPVDICKVEIWKGGNLVRYMTPTNSPAVGLYDSISGAVFTCAGSGTLSYGTFDMTGFTPLEYVECTASAHFDTGIYGTYSRPIIAKFRPGGSTPSYRNLFGARTGASAGRCDFQIGDTTTLNKTYYFYFNTGANKVYDSAAQTGNDLVFVKSNNVFSLYKNEAQLGTVIGAYDSSFTTSYTMFVCAMNNAGGAVNGFLGRLYFIGFGASRNYVPMSYNGVAGFYDTYNDTFHTSASANPFVAGPTL